MNSDTRRILSQFDTRDSSDLHQYYAEGQLRLRDRISNSSALLTLSVLAVTIVYQAAYRQGRLPSLPRLIWDAAVSLIPARLLFAVDRFVNPPLFPTHMLRSQPHTRAAKSEALQRILKINNVGGILGSVSQAGRTGLGKLSSVAPGGRAAGDRPPGLGNYDNSCYQNSILQGLASLKPLPAYLSAISLEKRLDLSPTRTVETLRDLIAELSSPCSNGRTLWTPKVLKNMSTWQQQDAQEYYSKLLDQIDNEIAKAARVLRDAPRLEPDCVSYDSSASQHSDDSGYHSLHGHPKAGPEPRLARNPLEGLMAQRVACVSCGYCEGLTMIPFNCLTLTLGSLPEHDLYERLDHYTKVESIQGVECPKCTLICYRDAVKGLAERTGNLPDIRQRLQALDEALEEEAFDEETLTKKCHITSKARASSTKTKQVALARPPQSLVFHMNRSGFDERTGYMFKNSAAVHFPMVLDLGPWCLGSADDQGKLGEEPAAARDVERWALDPKASMVAGDRRPSMITGPIYELRAVVTHFGNHENGHYICYRKHPVSSPLVADESEGTEKSLDRGVPSQGESESQWWCLSDDDVAQVDEKTVLSQGGVFMLFYDCVDHNSILVPGLDEPMGVVNSARDTKVSRGGSTSSPVTLNLGIVEGKDDASVGSDNLMQLDDAPPLFGPDTIGSERQDTSDLSETLGETLGEQQAASQDPEELGGRCTLGVYQDPVRHQETASVGSGVALEAVGGVSSSQSLGNEVYAAAA